MQYLVRTLAIFCVSMIYAEMAAGQEPTDETARYFAAKEVPRLRLTLSEKSQQKLREEPRQYVSATLIENDVVRFEKISVKLKGAAGSYQEFDDRPGLTVRMGKGSNDQNFHGMVKFHLNNSVQDETFLNEWLGCQLFHAAGYPAPQVSHVRLWINDRDMGLYVLREGFDDGFMRRTIGGTGGIMFDSGFLQDVDDPLEVDFGEEQQARERLRTLAQASAEVSPEKRFHDLADLVDFSQFIRFMALERMVGHWDGYSLNINNYRLYFPDHGKAIFLPHGMDQILGDPGAGLYDMSQALLAGCVVQNPAWRTAYQNELRNLAPLIKDTSRWREQVRQMQQKLTPVLESIDADLAASHKDRVAELLDRLQGRAQLLDELVEAGFPTPLEIELGQSISLTDWYPVPEAEDMELEEVEFDGRPAYSIRRSELGEVIGSWRLTVMLGRGRYRVETNAKVSGVVPLKGDLLRGVTVHRQGEPAMQRLTGSQNWIPIADEFDIKEDQQQLELVLEIRAKYGQAWFDRDSLKLIRLE